MLGSYYKRNRQQLSKLYYKVRQRFITKRFFTKCDRLLVQSASGITKSDRLLLKIASGITKCDSYYKARCKN